MWPLSREAYPKQFLDLSGSGVSMLQATVQRLQGLQDAAAPITICNEEHRFLVAEQLQRIGVQAGDIVLEPEARNTAPAVALAAFAALAKDSDATLLVLPADHIIEQVDAFQAGVEIARRAAAESLLVAFGIVPSSPETGYGYLEKGDALSISASVADNAVFKLKRFVEKPDLASAQRFLDEGGFTWNSGMFVFRADTYLEELKQF